MTDIVFLALLIAHVGSIVAWMGGAVLFISVITPSLRNMSPPSRGEFIVSTLPRYFRFVTGTSVAAVVAGLALYAYEIVTNQAPSMTGQYFIQAGAVLALVAIIILMGLGMPAGRKLVDLAKQMGKTPSDDMAAKVGPLQKRVGITARVGVAFLGITLILMLVGANI